MSLSYTVNEAISSLFRTKLSSIGSILTIAVALLLLGIYFIISLNASRVVQLIRDRVEVEAFCEEPFNRQRMVEIQEQLLTMKEVERVQFVSKEEAARVFKEEFGEDIADVLDFNPLPPSFKIFVKDEYKHSATMGEIVGRIKELKGIDDVIYRKDVVDFLDRRIAVANVIGLGLGLLIGISAVFLVSNTIRLAIYAKRKIIQTMKLVGATRWFIRLPFLLEGTIQGLLGGLVAAGAIYWILAIIARWVSAELAQFIRVDMTFYAVIVACGVALGLFGSVISVRRFIGESVLN
jgi:cell division transport system permease protein